MIPRAKLFGGPLGAYNLLCGDRNFTLASGCMDMLHRGHVEMLHAAKRAGGCLPLIVGVNSDESVRRLKGKKRPIWRLNDRLYMLAALTVVDGVFYFDDDTVASSIELLRPKVWVKGGDYTLKTLNKSEVRAAKRAGTKIIIVPRIGDWSTTGLIKQL